MSRIKKTSALLLCAALTSAALTACTDGNEASTVKSTTAAQTTAPTAQAAPDEDSPISFKLTETTPESAKLTINNKTNEDYCFGMPYMLMKRENGQWTDLTPENELSFTSLGYVVTANGESSYDIKYSDYYGKLDTGEYKLIMNEMLYNDAKLSFEFTIG